MEVTRRVKLTRDGVKTREDMPHPFTLYVSRMELEEILMGLSRSGPGVYGDTYKKLQELYDKP